MNAPTRIVHHRQSKRLEVIFTDGVAFDLPCEYLRVFSPSAEVRGHGGGEPLLLGGKRDVNIAAIEPVGRYAVRLRFSDGHDTGLYSWQVLHELGSAYAVNWQRYLARLTEHGMSRDSEVIKLSALGAKRHTPTPAPIQTRDPQP